MKVYDYEIRPAMTRSERIIFAAVNWLISLAMVTAGMLCAVQLMFLLGVIP